MFVKKKYIWGYLSVLASLLVTYVLWIGTMWHLDDWYDDAFKYPAKVGSMGTTILMCWAFILSTRFKLIEHLFGGLDKVYKAHRRIGELAFFLIFLHPVFLGWHRLPDWPLYARYFWFSPDWARNTGILALAFFTVLVGLSIWITLKYHRWKQTHHFFGLLLLLVVVHLVLGQGEIMRYPLLRVWFAAWIGIALLCYLYIRLLYRWFGPLHEYVLDAKPKEGDVIELHLRPLHQRHTLRHRAGQFVYVSFDSPSVSAELHPFSISSAPQNDVVRLSVKELGDWTSKLPELKPGARAKIWGPYGKFGDHLGEHAGHETILIAGGIGVTPFLSMLEDEAFKAGDRGKARLIYSVEVEKDAYYHDRLNELAKTVGHFEYLPHRSDDEGFLTTDYLTEKVGSLKDKVFLICGPKPLMDAMKEQLLEAEVPPEHIYTEDFSVI